MPLYFPAFPLRLRALCGEKGFMVRFTWEFRLSKQEVDMGNFLNGGRGMIEVMVASNSPVVREGLKSILGGFPEVAVSFLDYGWQALPAPVFDRALTC